MCGIAGQIWEPGRRADGMLEAYRDMRNALSRRGPGQNGMYIDGNVALIHAHLCVVDPENGLQPMGLCLGGEEYTLVYNGELYNTGELRRELKSLGHTFHTHSDTEVLLHAYGEWGEECVERLNGIYAFAVWERRGGRLFLARDRMGVKPLFYARRNQSLLFASELKALLRHPSEPLFEIVRPQALEELLADRRTTPWYGQLMATPQTIAYFLQLNYWLKKYRVRLCI